YRGRRSPRLVVEPGRSLVGDAQALATRVMRTRETPDGLACAILDAGINIAGILRNERHQIFRLTGFGAPAVRDYRLVRPTCQPGAVVYPCVSLPELANGDVLLIMDSGAYLEPDSTSFSFPRPATVALEGDQPRTIRRGESFADMIDRDCY